jgi:mono/diheme cytochrome c family protein
MFIMLQRTRFALFLTSLVVAVSGSMAMGQEGYNDEDFADYAADLTNGAVIFAAAGCATCHGTEGDANLLAGGRALPTKLGDLYAPNITAHATAGIGNWSSADFLNAVLLGVAPDGHRYFGAVFPFASYARMRPEDALDLRAYLADLPKSDAPSKPHNVSYVSRKILNGWTTQHDSLTVPADPQLARGQYLVEAVGHCAECHTPRDTGFGFRYDLDSERAFLGEVGLLGDYAPNISGAHIAGYGPIAFINGALAEGRKLNGNPMTSPAMRRISAQLATLPVEDRTAIYAYLTGAPLDPATIPQAAMTEPKDTPTPAETATLKDVTGAKALVSRIDAYCEATEPVTASTPVNAPAGADAALTAQADQVIETHCRSCHAPGKTYSAVFPTGDIADMPFDKRILTPGNPDASPLYESIASNRMPKGQKMTTEEVDILARWITQLSAAPITIPVVEPEVTSVSHPLFAGGTRGERMLSIATDLAGLPERDHPFVRYMSFAATPLAKIDCADSGARRNPMVFLHGALNKFINSVSRGPRVVAVTPVTGTEGAVVRIDLRDYGWTAEIWAALTTGVYVDAARQSGFSPEAWADLATPYPYAVDPGSDPVLGSVARAVQAPVPVMRADWFTHFGSEAPYYDMFLGLTAHIRDLEARLGLDVDRAILDGRMIRAAMLPGASGVSDHNRMLERFDLPQGGYYWKSYDFAGDDGLQSLVLHPDGPFELPRTRTGTESFHHDGGEMIFSLPNGLQGYYLSTNLGARLLVGPASIVSFRNKPIGKGVEIENARSCFDCHANGMIAKRDQLREVIEVSQRFDRDQRDLLLDMYIDNSELSEMYLRDSAKFLDALGQLNATEVSASGRPTSLTAPMSVGGGEIMTYLADRHFDTLDLAAVAREFFLDEATFRSRARQTGDAQLGLILSDWIARLDAGTKLHRSELLRYYAAILPRLTELRVYEPQDGYDLAGYGPGGFETQLEGVVDRLSEQDEITFAPAISVPMDSSPVDLTGQVKLAISVPKTQVHVGDLLRFNIQSNERCELQIFYVESHEGIEELPQGLLGPKFLDAGERREIPYPGSGFRLRFDSPGVNDTMLVFCRVGGLGDARMTTASVLDYAASRSQPLLRGIAIEAADRVSRDNGTSATNFVTFNVKP